MTQRHDKKAVFGWAMYDWANSAFATTVMAGFFPLFFKQFWSAGADPTLSTARLGLANSLAGIGIAICAPVLGAIADKGSTRKKFLLFFALLGAVMTTALYAVAKGDWSAAVLLYAAATIGFVGGNIFYDALIVSTAPENRLDMVSSLGFGLGYLGGGILFALNVWMTLRPAVFGFSGPPAAVQFSFITVGIWWAAFSIPLFLFVKELPVRKPTSGLRMVREGLMELKATFQEIRQLKTVFLFLLAYWLYIDGVDTIIRMAVDYGMSIGLASNDLIVALLITQFVGFPSAIGFGLLGKRIGAKWAIFAAITVYLFVTVWAPFMETNREFYVLAILVGLVQGGIQALSRSFYARMIPGGKSAEFFGFYNMVGKFSSVLGPALMGGVGLVARSMGYPGRAASRMSILAVSLFFVAGGILLCFVRPGRERPGDPAVSS